MGALAELLALNLSSNALTGQIPAELGALTKLFDLFLRGNSLSGCIPAALHDVKYADFDYLQLPFCHVLLSGLTVNPGIPYPRF